VDLTTADLLVGTSAGSVVAAQIAGGSALEELFAAQTAPPTGEIAARLGGATLLRFLVAMIWPGEPQRARARLGRAALRAHTVPEAERRAVIERRLPYHEWPDRRLLITAVNTTTGALVVFDRDSGVSLVDAVGASCAVPLVWPPVTIQGQHYMDGGVRSVTNADLAAGYARVVVIAPTTAAFRRADRVEAQLATLGSGVRAVTVSPDATARRAIGRNVLDPARRKASAEAGRHQAALVVDRVRAAWA
jgi:NTE family protein